MEVRFSTSLQATSEQNDARTQKLPDASSKQRCRQTRTGPSPAPPHKLSQQLGKPLPEGSPRAVPKTQTAQRKATAIDTPSALSVKPEPGNPKGAASASDNGDDPGIQSAPPSAPPEENTVHQRFSLTNATTPGNGQGACDSSQVAVQQAATASEPGITPALPTAQHKTRHQHPTVSQHPVLSTCRRGDLDELKSLLKPTPNLVNQPLEWGGKAATPLMIGCQYAQKNIIKELLNQQSADPNQTDNNGTSPLLMAAKNESATASILRPLLEKGAHVNHQDNLGETALMAVSRNKTGKADECAQLLLRRNANPRKTDHYGFNALTFACIHDQVPELIDTLLEKGVPVNQIDNFGNTPLIYAAYHLNPVTIQRLLSNGAIAHHRSNHRLSTLNMPGKYLVKARSCRLLPCWSDTPAKLVQRKSPKQLPQWLEKRWYSPEQISARHQQQEIARKCLELLQDRSTGSPEASPLMEGESPGQAQKTTT